MIFFKNLKAFNALLHLKPIITRESTVDQAKDNVLSDEDKKLIKDLSDKTDALYFQAVFNSLLKAAHIKKSK